MNEEVISDNNLEDMDRVTGDNSSTIVEVSEEEYHQLLMNMKAAKRGSREYTPITDSCVNHPGLFLHEDDKLVKPGDKFASHEDFIQYLNENAKRWFFYYSCYDSKKPNTDNESYTYICVYHQNKEKYKRKGIRKRNNTLKSDCPCKIRIRRLPNEDELTVVYVCNHHDHELSLEQFCKLQHGRRLPPYIKEEVMDFLALGVDKGKIRKYVEIETGFEMSSSYFYTLKKNLKMYDNDERHISDERLKMLNDKLAVVDEIYSGNQSSIEEMEDYAVETETPHRNKLVKPRQVLKNLDDKSDIKRKPGTSSEAPKSSKKIKIESDITFREILQSVKNLHESMKCETQKNPWVSDQCVPVLPNMKGYIKTEKIIEKSQQTSNPPNDPENEIVSYRIEYYNPEDNTQIVMNEFGEIINDDDSQPSVQDTNNDIENIAYETVVTDDNGESQDVMEEYVNDENDESQNVMEEYIDYEVDNDESTTCEELQERVNDNDYTNKVAVYSGSSKKDSVNAQTNDNVTVFNGEAEQNVNEYALADGEVILCHNDSEETENNNANDTVAIYNGDSEQNINDISHILVNNDEGVIEVDNVQYLPGDGEQVVQYVNDPNEESPGHDVGVQTNTNADGQMLLPVFDVYMKDGNVTGFVLNDNVINGLKEGIDKGIQTSEDIIYSDIQDIENEDSEIILNSSDKTGDTITKHEYVHRYNIDQYMTQPHFPKYVQILAKETNADVLNMFTNVYNEKAMFKLTTTQKGNEGNTRIRYITHNGKIIKKNKDDAKKEKLGRNLQSIFILKEKMRMMKKHHAALLKRNEYLEDIVLKVVNLER